MDMYTGKFIGLIKERQMRFEGRLGEHLAELEAKWEREAATQAEYRDGQEEGSGCGGRICNHR